MARQLERQGLDTAFRILESTCKANNIEIRDGISYLSYRALKRDLELMIRVGGEPTSPKDYVHTEFLSLYETEAKPNRATAKDILDETREDILQAGDRWDPYFTRVLGQVPA